MILVIGDIMLDKYIRGKVTRLAPEAPVPVVLTAGAEPELRLGGAANVASSVAALGKDVSLLGPYGHDRAEELHHLCAASDIRLLGTPTNMVTTVKTRIVDPNGRLLIRLDNEKRADWEGAAILRSALVSLRPTTVVFSDYDKGCWTFGNWQTIINHFKLRTAPSVRPRRLIVDAKRRLEQYEGAGMIKCNQSEWDRFGGDPLCPIESHAVVTKGKAGLSHAKPPGPGRAGLRQWVDIAAMEHDVHDVTGAGDVVTAVIAVGLSLNLPMQQILESAVTASSVSVMRPMTGVADPANTKLSGGEETP